MIRFLSIRQLAVIESLDLSLDAGLTVLTGETGAGKSVLVEGIGLLLGGRASADMVRTGASLATVQAIMYCAVRSRSIMSQGCTSTPAPRSAQ